MMGALFASVVFLGAINQNAVQPIVSVERTVFYRERAAGMYSSLPYALAQVEKIGQTILICSLTMHVASLILGFTKLQTSSEHLREGSTFSRHG